MQKQCLLKEIFKLMIFFCLIGKIRHTLIKDLRGMTHSFLDWKKKSKSNAKLKNKVLWPPKFESKTNKQTKQKITQTWMLQSLGKFTLWSHVISMTEQLALFFFTHPFCFMPVIPIQLCIAVLFLKICLIRGYIYCQQM